MSYKERQIAEDLAQACRVLGAYDMTHAALGHVSFRVEGSDAMMVKGKGPNEVGLRYTRPSYGNAFNLLCRCWRRRLSLSGHADRPNGVKHGGRQFCSFK